MEVELYFDARADVTVKGKVERIVPKRIEGNSPQYNIYISLSEVPDGLADGMTTDAAVTIAKKAGALCLPRAVVRASGENRVVLKVWNGAATETREVTIGLRGDAFIEILAGLKEGDQVVTK
jgi:Cu(I)/Ag(I) efflux system membrane fusion protein